MARLIDLTDAERAHWAMRFYRAAGAAAISAWLFMLCLGVLGLLIFPLVYVFVPEAVAELTQSDTSLWEVLGSLALLLLLVPLLYALGVYLAAFVGRTHRRVLALAGMGAVTVAVLTSLLSAAVLPPLLLLSDDNGGGLDPVVAGIIGSAVLVHVLQIAATLLVLGALWDLVRVDDWSFAAARGFIPSLRRPSAVLQSTLGLPFYMSVSNQRGRWGPALKLALHNLLASMIAIGVFNALVNSGSTQEQSPTAIALAEIAPADREWLLAMPANLTGYLDKPVALLVSLLICLVGAAVLGPLAWWLGRSARRQLTRSYGDARTRDARAPVLFLRSFRDDSVALKGMRRSILNRLVLRFGDARTLDEMLLETGGAYGPVCAIGKPGEPSPPFGAARQYVDDESWRASVEDLAREAHAIVIVVDETSGVQWEVDRIAALGLRGKTLFLPSPALAPEERETVARRILGEGSWSASNREIVGFTFDDAGVAKAYLAKRLGRDAVRMALTRFLLEKRGYPDHAVARPRLNADEPQLATVRRAWHWGAPVVGVAGLAACGVAFVVVNAHSIPDWRGLGEQALFEMRQEETVRRERAAVVDAASAASSSAPGQRAAPDEFRVDQRTTTLPENFLNCHDQARPENRFICSGDEHLRARRYREASTDYGEAVELSPNNVRALTGLGEALVGDSQYQRASAYVERALQLNPSGANAHLLRGRIAQAAGRRPEAIVAYNEALRLNPDLFLGYLVRGLALSEEGRQDEALADANEAFRRSPRQSYWLRGSIYARKRELAAARADLTAALEVDENDAFSLVWLGNVHHFEGDYAGAAELYRRAIAIQPSRAMYHENLGNSLRLAGDRAGARAAFGAALALDSALVESIYWVAELDAADNHPERALGGYQRILAINPTHYSARLGVARTLRTMRRTDAAEAAYTAMIEAHGEQTTLWRERGHVRFEAARYAGAVEDYTEALARAPDNAELLIDRAFALLWAWRLTEAAADADEALARAPTNTRAMIIEGLIRQSRLDYQGAFNAFDAALALEPGNADALANRGAARLRLGDSASALADADAALRLAPNNAVAVITRCAVLAVSAPAEAGGACATAVERHPGTASWAAAALAHYHTGDFAAALPLLDRAARTDPLGGSRYMRGLVLSHLGRREEGEREVAAAIASDPTVVERYRTIWRVDARR